MGRFYDVIDSMENQGYVVKSVMFEDGTVMDFEMVDGNEEEIVSVEVVSVSDYEANGYDVEGLEGEWRSAR